MKVSWSILVFAAAASCLAPPDCFQKNNNYVGIYFRKVIDGHADTVKIVKIIAAGATQPFDSLVTTTSVSLPLNYLEGNTVFDIRLIDRNYLMNLGYNSKPQFLKPDCAEHFVLSDLSILESLGIDSVRLHSTSLTNPAHLNMTIYRCPRNNNMKLSFRQYYLDTIARGALDTRDITSVTDDFSGVVYQNVSASQLLLPLNNATSRTTFTFRFADGSANTLAVQYDLNTKTKWQACGSQPFPDHLTVLSENFEVLHLREDSLYDPPRVNIETFRCPVTNLVKAVFKDPAGSSVQDTLISVTSDIPGLDTLYRHTIAGDVTLPLSLNKTTTVYHFQFKNKTDVLTLGYNTSDEVVHADCGTQKIFTLLEVIDSKGFSQAPRVTDPTIKFPAGNNLEIIQ